MFNIGTAFNKIAHINGCKVFPVIFFKAEYANKDKSKEIAGAANLTKNWELNLPKKVVNAIV
jgi:hypothetical protein